jgi:hypothetical protein
MRLFARGTGEFGNALSRPRRARLAASASRCRSIRSLHHRAKGAIPERARPVKRSTKSHAPWTSGNGFDPTVARRNRQGSVGRRSCPCRTGWRSSFERSTASNLSLRRGTGEAVVPCGSHGLPSELRSRSTGRIRASDPEITMQQTPSPPTKSARPMAAQGIAGERATRLVDRSIRRAFGSHPASRPPCRAGSTVRSNDGGIRTRYTQERSIRIFTTSEL